VVRSTLGPAVADQLLGEHSAVKAMLATLDTMAATDANFDMQLRGSMDAMVAHMQVGRERKVTVLHASNCIMLLNMLLCMQCNLMVARMQVGQEG
jgi:hypothetical protein